MILGDDEALIDGVCQGGTYTEENKFFMSSDVCGQ